MNLRTVLATWSTGIVIWCLICVGGWYLATHDDYTKLALARACHGSNLPSQVIGSQCADTEPSDILVLKAKINRKAAISRIVGALGASAALGLWIFLGRPGLGNGSSRST